MEHHDLQTHGGIRPRLTLTGTLTLSVAFTAFLVGIAQLLARTSSRQLLSETGPIELAQLAILGGAVLTFVQAGRREQHASVFMVIATLVGCMLIRELDAALDRVVHGFWKVPAYALACAHSVWAWRHRARLVESARAFASSPAAGLLLGALAMVLVQARLLGQQRAWAGALGQSYMREVPRLVEETSELAGYGLLLLAAAEAVRGASGQRRSHRSHGSQTEALEDPGERAVVGARR